MKVFLFLFLLNGNIETHRILVANDINLSLASCEYVGLSSLVNQRILRYGNYSCEVTY